MKDKFMCISIREDGYGIFSNGGWASYNKEGKITGSCGDINSFPASLSISIAGKKECDTNKTLEQRVADLEKQLAGMGKPTNCLFTVPVDGVFANQVVIKGF
ncbi:hypothetical protein ACMFGU_18265 [Morganella morganii]|uniref:hypothetical protein n=1 Tax=Morganella morganii TaxID=582 RepID=UPI0032DA2872